MPISHPLEFYYKLIEENELEMLSLYFLNGGDFSDDFMESRNDDYSKCSLDWDEEKKGYHVELDYSNKESTHYFLSFEKYIGSLLRAENKRIKKLVRFNRLKSPNEATEYSKNLQIEIANLSTKSLIAVNEATGMIIAHLNALDIFLKEYINRSNSEAISPNSLKVPSRLIWHGKLNVLLTLFYDLKHGSNNLNEKFLQVEIDVLKEFILNSFCKRDGKALSRATLDTCFRADRDDKRSKKYILIRQSLDEDIPQLMPPKAKSQKKTNKVLEAMSISKRTREALNGLAKSPKD